MKCPNRLRGPINRPTLVGSGYGDTKKCPVCKKYFSVDGDEVSKLKNPAENRSGGTSIPPVDPEKLFKKLMGQ